MPRKTPASKPARVRRPQPAEDRPWFVVWTPYLALLMLLGLAEAWGGTGNATPRKGGAPLSAEALGRFLDEGPSGKAAAAFRQAIGSTPETVVREVVVERFQHWTGRTPASYMLGLVGAPAVPLLTGLLDHEVERVRQQAAFALGDIGMAAAPAVTALEKLARRSPPDASSRAAMNSLGDVAPSGFAGWFWKVWYEVPFAAVVLIVLVPLVAGIACPRSARNRPAGEDPWRLVPPLWASAIAAVVALWFLVPALRELLGAHADVEGDLWQIAMGVWCVGGIALAANLRRRAAQGPRQATGVRPAASSGSA